MKARWIWVLVLALIGVAVYAGTVLEPLRVVEASSSGKGEE